MKPFLKIILLFALFGLAMGPLHAQRINPTTQIQKAPAANYLLLSNSSSDYAPVTATTLNALLPDEVQTGTVVPTTAPTGLLGGTFLNTATGIFYTWNSTAWVAQSPQIQVFNLDIVTPLPSTPGPAGSVALKTVDLNGTKLYAVSNGTVWLQGGIFLDTGAVATIYLSNDAVTTAKILDGTIVAGDIATSAVTTAKILDGTILPADLASNSVTTVKILDDAVTNAKIIADAVTTDKILNGTIVGADFRSSAGFSVLGTTGAGGGSVGDITATTAGHVLQLNSSGTVLGFALVGYASLSANSVDSVKINNGTVSLNDLAPTGATTGQVPKWNGTKWTPSVDATGGGGSITTYSAGNGAIVTATGTGVTFVRTSSSNWTLTVPSGVELLSFDINSTSAQSATSALDLDIVFAGSRAYNQDASVDMTDGKVPILTTLKKITPATYPSTAAGNNVAFTADVTAAGTLRLSTAEFSEIGGGGAQATSVKGTF